MIAEKVWRPFARQEEFLSLPDSIFEALYGGAAGGGKSECLLLLPIARGFYQHPRFKGLLLRRTYPELERELIVRSQEWYPATGASYNDDKKRWTFPSGAIMQFGHCEYDSDVHKYDSAEYNYMGFDELTSFTEYQYLYLSMTRVRSSTPELPTIIRSGTNPGNVGHGWVRSRFIEPASYGSIILDKLTGMKRIFIQSLVTDNPHIDPGYLQRLGMLPEAERRAKRDGDWYIFAGQVFDDWRECPLPQDPPNACHVIEPFEIPLYWPRFLAIDWGFSAMTVALWGAISPDGRLYIYREHACKGEKISTWATEVGRLSAYEEIKDAVICHSAYQQRGDQFTIAEQFEQHSGLKIHAPDNDRLSGLLLLREYIRWKQKPSRKILPKEVYNQEKASEILRKYGTKSYYDYLESFIPQEDEVNIPKLQVFENCVALRKAIPLCVYDDDKKEDVAEFVGDDPYDCIRYLVKMVDHYIHDANYLAERAAKIANVVKQLEETQDQTRFHRRMERLESLEYTPRPVRRRCAR